MKRVFVDGAAGTTGLKLMELLAPMVASGEIAIVAIENLKDLDERLRAYQTADLAVMCLPDEVARETIGMLRGRDARVLDASSAHRVSEGWMYGFPELASDQPTRIASAMRVTNPGCFATGAVALIRPLRDAGLIAPEQRLTIVGVSGYTGGGKRLIARHEEGGPSFALANVVGAYSLGGRHKHVAEIKQHGGVDVAPVFMPHVLNVPRGLMVSIVLGDVDVASVRAAYEEAYAHVGSKVWVSPQNDEVTRLNFERFVDLNRPGSTAPPQDDVEIHTRGWTEDGTRQVSVHALLDNLGKGAATQVVQNLRLMLRLDREPPG